MTLTAGPDDSAARSPSPNDETPPAVSVVVLSFNHADFVDLCLDAVLAQTFADWELVIVDDASSDGTQERITSWLETAGVAATFVALETNRGICFVMNEALRHCSGRYIATCAADDLWKPDKLRRQVTQFETAPADVAVLYSDAIMIDEGGEPTGERFLGTYDVDPSSAPTGHIAARLLQGNFIPVPTTMVRRSALTCVGPFDEGLPYEDWDMWLRLARHHQFRFDEGSPTASYRVLSSSLMRNIVSRPEFRLAQVRIPQKWIDDPAPEVRAAALAKMGLEARALYRADRARAVAPLGVLTRRQRSVRWGWLAVASRCRLPYLWARRVEKAVDLILDRIAGWGRRGRQRSPAA